MLNEIFAEFIGTFLLLLLGNGVVANVVLRDTKGSNGGWIVISLGWGLGVFVGVTVAGPSPGAERCGAANRPWGLQPPGILHGARCCHS